MAESNRIIEFITPFINELQNIEYVLDDLKKKRMLFIPSTETDVTDPVQNANGDQLDRLGEIVDEARQSRTDSDYYAAIMRKIIFNNSCGQPDILIRYYNLVTGALVEYYEPSPATILIVIKIVPENEDWLSDVGGLKPAGVKIGVVFVEDNATAFATLEDDIATEGLGFLEEDYAEAGHDYTAGVLAEEIIIF